MESMLKSTRSENVRRVGEIKNKKYGKLVVVKLEGKRGRMFEKFNLELKAAEGVEK